MNTQHCLLFFTSSLLLLTTPVFCQEFTSTPEATELIELYTSEGCSSCPPADKWLRQLKSNPQLFKKFLPLSFHVDYWNRLGWRDRFSRPQHTNRQYQHHKEGNINQVYTPEFVFNNKEWRNWRLNKLFPWPDKQEKAGILKAEYNRKQQQLNVSFTPELNINDNELIINVAVLGMGLSSHVKLGENRGRMLEHDFVVLEHNQHRIMLTNAKTQQWQITMPTIPENGQKQSALVIWLSSTKSLDVIQATGGYL